MSLSRHACRHALRQAGIPTTDHPWVSDDLIAAAFCRFAHGQRRHGSSVPGPLEARRRLAKRRNTALAGVGGAEDIACLFGRNGREHMKWTDHPWQRSPIEVPDRNNYAVATHEITLPFYDHNPDPIIPESNSPSPGEEPPTVAQRFEQFLEKNDWTPEYAKDFTRRLGIDLQREPEYSRRIFEHLLSRPTADLTQAIDFLDDPFLNTRGSGNYLRVLQTLKRAKTPSSRTAVLKAVTRALELGLVPTDELCLILQALPLILIGKRKTLGKGGRKMLHEYYHAMWTAIGRCTILGYHDLDKDVVDIWIQELLSADIMSLAEEMVIQTHDANSSSQWPTALVLSSLERDNELAKVPGRLLSQLEPNCAAKCIVDVTELLALSARHENRDRVLRQWQDSLLEVSSAEAIAGSPTWTDLPLAYLSDFSSSSRMQIQRQIVCRLWALRTLSRSLGPMHMKGLRATDPSAYILLHLYESVTHDTEGSFLANFLSGIHDLQLPYNGLLLLATDLKLRNTLRKAGRNTLVQLETSQISLACVWEDPAMHKGVQNLFHGSFEKMIRRIDPTSPIFVAELLEIARTGDSEKAWSIIRLLKSHTAFKICLNKAWTPLPCPEEKILVRYHPGPRDSRYPDPYVAADLIHQLAVAFSCCPKLSPSRAFTLVHCLYDYLRRHGGPVYPSLVRAMYHAGIVRYRREGLRVSATRYEYIMWITNKFEGIDVVRQLNADPQLASVEIPTYET
ncbi:hypothetical protein N7470_004351 [Penicillium chermesinum]|nr:hypothetical protein N7470_004351 [Penicillium chermesinum]